MAGKSRKRFTKWMPPILKLDCFSKTQSKRGDCISVPKNCIIAMRDNYNGIDAKIVSWIDKEIKRSAYVIRQTNDSYIGCIISARSTG